MHTCYLDSNLFYVGWLFLSGTGNFYTILRPNKHRQHPEETSNHITYTSNKLLNRMTKKTQQHPTPPLWQVAHDVTDVTWCYFLSDSFDVTCFDRAENKYVTSTQSSWRWIPAEAKIKKTEKRGELRSSGRMSVIAVVQLCASCSVH